MRKILLRTHNHLGDIVILSGAAHHFRAAHPEYIFTNDSRYREVFQNSPDFDLGGGWEGKPVTVDYRLHGGNEHTGNHGSLVNGALWAICRGLGLPPPEIDDSRCCYLPEPKASIPDEWRGVIVLNANCQECSTVKLYPYWQRVVASLPQHRFALIGGTEARDICAEVAGPSVLNLRGKTSYQQLFRLVKEASLVVSPSSAVVHIASAYGVPCLCVSGASEPVALTRYPNVRHLWGECEGRRCRYDEHHGCRHFRAREDSCERTLAIDGRTYARCIASLPSERVSEAIAGMLL